MSAPSPSGATPAHVAAVHYPDRSLARRGTSTILAACIAVFIAQVANAMPVPLNGLFQADLQASGTQLTWITTIFQLGVLVFEFTFGVLGDVFGRRRLVMVGALTMAVGSVVCALAPSVEILWVGAAVNGLGAGAVCPGTLALVAAVSHTAESRARSVAMWSGCIGGAAVVGPAFAALFAKGGDWRSPFWVLVALALLAAAITRLMAQGSSAPEGRGFDTRGQVTFAAGVLLVMFGAVQGADVGWGSASVVGSFIIGGILLASFVAVEVRAKTPVLATELAGAVSLLRHSSRSPRSPRTSRQNPRERPRQTISC